MNDIAQERTYVWTDGTWYDHDKDYRNWAPGAPNHNRYCAKEKDWFLKIFEEDCERWSNYGINEDAVYIQTNGQWQYSWQYSVAPFACYNPNTQSMTSEMFKDLFDSIECITVNRAPLVACQEFTF